MQRIPLPGKTPPPGETRTWRKSSHSSGPAGTCVEVGQAARVLVRDTANRSGATLAFAAGSWQAFTATLKDLTG
jgi:hypothetical protein